MLSNGCTQLDRIDVTEDSVDVLVEETEIEASMWVFDEIIADLLLVIFDLFQQFVDLLVSLVVLLQNHQLFLIQGGINGAIHSCDLTERFIC